MSLQNTQRNPHPRRERELQVYRCSRPLCSSQETDSTTAAIPHPRKAATACTEDPGRTRSLRTQQRARNPSPPHAPVPQPRKGETY